MRERITIINSNYLTLNLLPSEELRWTLATKPEYSLSDLIGGVGYGVINAKTEERDGLKMVYLCLPYNQLDHIWAFLKGSVIWIHKRLPSILGQYTAEKNAISDPFYTRTVLAHHQVKKVPEPSKYPPECFGRVARVFITSFQKLCILTRSPFNMSERAMDLKIFHTYCKT